VLHFGLGPNNKIDSLIVGWPNMRRQTLRHLSADTVLLLRQQEADQSLFLPTSHPHPLFQNTTAQDITGSIRHQENPYIDFDQENLMPKMLSTEGPRLAVGDVNGDGLEDFITGGAAYDTTRLFLQDPNGHFTEKPQPAFAADRDYENTGLEFFDADNDGDLDLVAAAGGGQEKPGSLSLLTRLYLNDGKGNFTKSHNGWPLIAMNASCVRANDLDGDGRTDIFIGGRSITGSYGRSPGCILLKNQGNAIFRDITASIAPELASVGMVTDARWADIDGDGKKELILVGDWMPVTIFKYTGGQLKKWKTLPHSSGWWNCLTIADIDGDGRPDLIAGNNGLNSKLRADEAHPARLFEGDFNNNGRSQCIAAYYKTDGRSYPINLRSDLVAQIPLLKKKFLRYDSYAGKTIEEVLSADQRNKALQLTVEQTNSCIFYNQRKGDFIMQPLPQRAQFSTVYAIEVTAINNDGKPDIFLAGNFYGLKPEIGRNDASYGVSLLNDGNRNFHYLSPAESGLFIRGEVRDVQSIRTPGGRCLIATRNNDSLQLFRRNP
jgi:hypothetical protein